jgi:Arc/MetJ-type ribon-helix-helix transcriptional regulator
MSRHVQMSATITAEQYRWIKEKIDAGVFKGMSHATQIAIKALQEYCDKKDKK